MRIFAQNLTKKKGEFSLNEHLNELWQLMYAEIENIIPMGDRSINLWFGSIELKYISGDAKIYFSIDNYIKKKFIEEHHMKGFCEAIRNILGFEPVPVLICTERDSFENQFAELVASESDKIKAGADSGLISQEKNSSTGKLSGEEIDKMYSGIMGEQSTEENETEIPSNDLYSAVHRGVNAGKRYNPESGRLEEVALFENINSKKDGVLMISPSAPACYPSYTFENFVVGSSNRFAYQYALQASRYPAQQYNPLYIYGAPGLGKTHLLYAITNEIMKRNPNFNIIYVKGEDFTNELVEAIQKRTPLQFREKYRKADVLLMDDVQFIAGRESTQEEFFHTYNALYETGKQIIMTSDKPPRDINALEERLKSRFESGIIQKIDAPDIELRTAIIKKKFEIVNIDISNEVIMYLSENIKDNIRQIEGIIKKMNAYCLMNNQNITMEIAEKFVSDIITVNSKIDCRKVLNAAAEKYEIPADIILGKKRTSDVAWARHMAIYVTKQLTELTYSEIGKFYNRDHATIMAAFDKIKENENSNPAVAREIEELISLVKLKA